MEHKTMSDLVLTLALGFAETEIIKLNIENGLNSNIRLGMSGFCRYEDLFGFWVELNGLNKVLFAEIRFECFRNDATVYFNDIKYIYRSKIEKMTTRDADYILISSIFGRNIWNFCITRGSILSGTRQIAKWKMDRQFQFLISDIDESTLECARAQTNFKNFFLESIDQARDAYEQALPEEYRGCSVIRDIYISNGMLVIDFAATRKLEHIFKAHVEEE